MPRSLAPFTPRNGAFAANDERLIRSSFVPLAGKPVATLASHCVRRSAGEHPAGKGHLDSRILDSGNGHMRTFVPRKLGNFNAISTPSIPFPWVESIEPLVIFPSRIRRFPLSSVHSPPLPAFCLPLSAARPRSIIAAWWPCLTTRLSAPRVVRLWTGIWSGRKPDQFCFVALGPSCGPLAWPWAAGVFGLEGVGQGGA
jgi:hypothetical protein